MDTMDKYSNMDIDLSDIEEPVQQRTASGEIVSQDVLIRQDLDKSGLVGGEDIYVMPYDSNIGTAIGAKKPNKGYAIRYYDYKGKLLPHYRVRIFDADMKYLSIRGSGNQIYFPEKFYKNYVASGKKLIILTEGEKKAALLAKYGFPACALSGVDCWSNKTYVVPKNLADIGTPHPYAKNMLVVKKESINFDMDSISSFAKYLEELGNMLYKDKSTLVFCYDSDIEGTETEYKKEVQRSAATLAYEFRSRGIGVKNIKQLTLTNLGEKTGVDDFIMSDDPRGGLENFKKQLNAVIQKEVAFPNYPNIREYINKQLSRSRLVRKNFQQISAILMSDLDRRGKRMFSNAEGQLYYFDSDTKHLMKVMINEGVREQINETDFGRLLYKEYDISAVADGRLMHWLGTILPAEEPIENVNPSKIIARPAYTDDCIRYQLNDGQFIKVTGDEKKPYQIFDNGQDSTLFSSGTQIPISVEDLKPALERQFSKPLTPWWFDVLKNVKLKEQGNAAMAMGLLYYISPWLYRWRGTQLPVELVCGESGSGKSTLVSLRLNILMGESSLKNAPGDLKDWYAQITQSGGMHVIDNLVFTDKQLAQRMSDELCRLVTEPNPTIEQRKYFTNADVIKFPVNAIFSFTAIKQPFNNADLIQRAFILNLDKVQAIKDMDSGEEKDYAFDGMWMQHQLDRFGGRTEWLAHHLHVLHKFFALVEKEWDWKYKAKYRLINLEQCMVLMAKVLGVEHDWIPGYLASTTNSLIKDSDWVLQGLRAYADSIRKKHGAEAHTQTFSAAAIATWCDSNEDYEENAMLVNSRILGKYLQTAKYNIATIAGIIESHKQGNKQMYHVTKTPPEIST